MTQGSRFCHKEIFFKREEYFGFIENGNLWLRFLRLDRLQRSNGLVNYMQSQRFENRTVRGLYHFERQDCTSETLQLPINQVKRTGNSGVRFNGAFGNGVHYSGYRSMYYMRGSRIPRNADVTMRYSEFLTTFATYDWFVDLRKQQLP